MLFRSLKKEMDEGRFRADLYYRLNVFPITLPALRDRIDDVPLLVEFFIKQLAPSLGIAPPRIAAESMACMMRYDWPGNIRELRNVVERCALLCEKGEIRPMDLPMEVVRAAGNVATPSPVTPPVTQQALAPDSMTSQEIGRAHV